MFKIFPLPEVVLGVGFIKFIKENPIFLSDSNSTPFTVETTSNKFVQLYIYYDSFKHAYSHYFLT